LKKVWLQCLLAVLLVVPMGNCLAASDFPFVQSGVTIRENTNDWGMIMLNDGYFLMNNVWNKGAASGVYSQRLFRESLNGKPAIGWQWQWPYSVNVVAYPEVIYGDKPWDKPLGLVADFPFQAGSKQVTANFDIKLQASGTYNMAFTLWAITDPANPKKTISHEIMIWNVNHNLTPAGAKKETITVGGNTFDVYVKSNHGDDSGANANMWTYVGFAPRESVLKGPFDIGAFLDYLIDQGILTTANYITSIELGNEIVTGKGITEISNYGIVIKNKQ
jgi:serralysin